MAATPFDIRKVYLYASLLTLVILVALSLLASSVLEMKTDEPYGVYQDFKTYSDLLAKATLICFAVLHTLAATVHARRGSGLYYLLPLTLLIVFANYNHGFLGSRFYEFKSYHDMLSGGFEMDFLLGIFYSFAGLIIVVLTYSLIHLIRKRRKKAY